MKISTKNQRNERPRTDTSLEFSNSTGAIPETRHEQFWDEVIDAVRPPMLLDPHEDPLLLDMRGKALAALETATVPPKGKTTDPGAQQTEPTPPLASTSSSEPADTGLRKTNRMWRTLLDVRDKARMAFETPKTPPGKGTTSSGSDEDNIDDQPGEPRIIWIALMGAGGTGKTTFISHLVDEPVQVGHGLRSRMYLHTPVSAAQTDTAWKVLKM